MQRANSNGIPFLRRQSTAAPPAVPYANPAATQFLRLGVGIDHVDVEHSDDEDIIYQGIENGMDGHDDEEEEDETENDDEEDDDDELEDGQLLQAANDGDINLALQQQLDQQVHANDDSMGALNNLVNANKNNPKKMKSSQQEPMVAQRNEMPSTTTAATRTRAQSNGATTATSPSLSPTISSSQETITARKATGATATRGGASTNPAALPASSIPASPRCPPTSINTQLHPAQTLSATTDQKNLPLSPTKKQQGQQGPTSPTSPLAQGLPTYHEKFTKASSNKIHGASPLSNVSNTITASVATNGPFKKIDIDGALDTTTSATTTTTTTPSASRRSMSAATRLLTETILMPGTESDQFIPQIKRFAEKNGVVTVHTWKIHYKICYPTLDPSYRVNGNGRNIILFHGALSNLGTWRKVQQTLADRTGCRVLSYDRVGHGLSDKPSTWPKNTNPYRNGGVLAICQSLLETLGMQQNLVLIGNGTGASIASAIALSNPQVVRGLILVAPSIQNEAPPLYLRACVSYPPPLSWIYRGLYGNHGPLQQFYYKPKAMMADPSTVDMYMAPTKEEGFWRGLSNATKYRTSYKIDKHLDRLTEISTLIMTGDVDDIVPTMETLRLFETLQSARTLNVPQVLKIIKHAGHLPQEEKPTDFIKVASFFIRKVCLGSLSRERSLGRRSSGGVLRTLSKRSTNNIQVPGRGDNAQTLTEANTQANTHPTVQGNNAVSPVPILGPGFVRGPTTGQGGRTMASPGANRNEPMTRSPPTIPSMQPAPLHQLAQGQPIKSY